MSINIKCNKCSGKVFIDDTFDSAELFCIICGKRDFVYISHPMFGIIHQSIESNRTT